MKISACVIAKNEEKNIAKCINSFKGFVHEIILIDTGSTDNTVEIAKKHGAKVLYFKWNNDFAAAKNFAISRAKGEWIVFLDADEYFADKTAEKLPDILEKADKSYYDAIGCKITNIDIDENERIIDSFPNIRFFKNDKNIRYRNKVHETLYKKKGKINVLILYNEITVYHTGYSASIQKTKAERNLKLLLEGIQENEINRSNYCYLCDCYFGIGDYDKCIEYGKLHIDSGIITVGYQSKVYKNIIDALYLKKAPKEEIEEEIKRAIKAFSDHPNFYFKYGLYLLDEKRYEEALNKLLKAEKLNSEYKGIEINFVTGKTNFLSFKIGYLYCLKNLEDKALDYYYTSLKMDKYNTGVFQALFELISTEHSSAVINLFNTIYNVNDEVDIEFLVNQLKKRKAGEVFGYYVNIWNGKFKKEDSSLSFLLLAMGRFNSAFNIYYNAVRQGNSEKANQVLATVSAIMSQEKGNILKLVDYVDQSLKRILLKFLDESIILQETDWNDFVSILSEIMFLNKTSLLKKISAFSLDFQPEACFNVALMFQKNRLYDHAIDKYYEYLSNSNCNIGSAYMGIGYCKYKKRSYDEAVRYFEKAIENGYLANDVNELLRWAKSPQ